MLAPTYNCAFYVKASNYFVIFVQLIVGVFCDTIKIV